MNVGLTSVTSAAYIARDQITAREREAFLDSWGATQEQFSEDKDMLLGANTITTDAGTAHIPIADNQEGIAKQANSGKGAANTAAGGLQAGHAFANDIPQDDDNLAWKIASIYSGQYYKGVGWNKGQDTTKMANIQEACQEHVAGSLKRQDWINSIKAFEAVDPTRATPAQVVAGTGGSTNFAAVIRGNLAPRTNSEGLYVGGPTGQSTYQRLNDGMLDEVGHVFNKKNITMSTATQIVVFGPYNMLRALLDQPSVGTKTTRTGKTVPTCLETTRP